MGYRLTIEITYTTTGNATTATSAINTALTNAGYSEQAVRTGSAVDLIISDIPTQSAAESIRNALLPAWSGSARSGGRAAVVRTDP